MTCSMTNDCALLLNMDINKKTRSMTNDYALLLNMDINIKDSLSLCDNF